MKQILPLLLCGSLASTSVFGQTASRRHCGQTDALQSMMAADPAAAARWETWRAETIAQSEAYLQDAGMLKTTAQAAVPVVFHIVLTQGQLNQILGTAGVEQRVDSSFAVLRRDYNRRNPDSVSIPSVFKPAYGNADIDFKRATRTPSNAVTNGVEILILPATAPTSYPVNQDPSAPGSQFFGARVKYTPSEGGVGLAAWDPTKYLNVWVCNLGPSGILGVAVPPSLVSQFGIPQREQGVVLNYGAFGKRPASGPAGYYLTGIDGGRTLVHEVGHFFELEHIFGFDVTCPNQGDDDDGIADTPPQDEENYGCPSSIPFNSCSSLGKMYVNYMDYSDDACLLMFTYGQVSRMRAQITGNGPSVGLVSNPQLAVEDAGAEVALGIYPNPASGTATLSLDARNAARLTGLTMTDATGRTLRQFEAKVFNSGTGSLNLAGLAAGVYFVHARFADGGTATQKLVIQ